MIFYQSDGKTILPNYDEAPTEKLQIPPSTPLSSEEANVLALDDRYLDHIEEALGPQPKWQRKTPPASLAPSPSCTTPSRQGARSDGDEPVKGDINIVSLTPDGPSLDLTQSVKHPLSTPLDGEALGDDRVPDPNPDLQEGATSSLYSSASSDVYKRQATSSHYTDDDIDPDITEAASFELETMADGTLSNDESIKIEGHKFKDGILHFKCILHIGEAEFYNFSMMKRDHPSLTSQYILKHDVGDSGVRRGRNRFASWARTFQRQFKNTVRRTIRLNAMDSLTTLAYGGTRQQSLCI